MRNFEHMYKFIPMRGPEMKGFAEMAVWKGAVVQAQTYGPAAPQNHVPSGNEKEEPCGDKSGPLDRKVSDSISPVPADQSSIRASGNQIQSNSEPRKSGEFFAGVPLADSRIKVESSHLASTDSSSEEEVCTVKTETHKKGVRLISLLCFIYDQTNVLNAIVLFSGIFKNRFKLQPNLHGKQ